MTTNKTVNTNVFYPELSYLITGILFSVHNELGRFEKEKRYCDLIEKKFKESKIAYKREHRIGEGENIADFMVDEKIILELKTVRIITKENYRQIQNYLQQTGIDLGVLVNFRMKYIKPIRVIRVHS